MKVCEGWLEPVRKVPSPNYNTRPNPQDISLLVVHNISLPPNQYGGGFIEQFFCNQLDCSKHEYFAEIQNLQVSAHCLIDRAGQTTQFVPFDQRAWHAGQSVFDGRENCNDFSIGVELEGADDEPYANAQYQTLAELTIVLMRQYPKLNRANIVGHSDIAPGRKTDPGAAFDWPYFRSLLELNP